MKIRHIAVAGVFALAATGAAAQSLTTDRG